MIRQAIECELRGSDPAGEGHYGASRGDRTHNGIDYKCVPGAAVLSPVYGEISKLGYPYADLQWRYIEITDDSGLHYRLFYVKPIDFLGVGSHIDEDDIIGIAQDISERYPDQGMTPHIHYEIKDQA